MSNNNSYPGGQPSPDGVPPIEIAAQHHESSLLHIVQGVGHVAAAVGSFFVVRYPHLSQESVAHAQPERRHKPDDFTAFTNSTPKSWGSQRRT